MTSPLADTAARGAEARRLAASGEAKRIREDARVSVRDMAGALGCSHSTLLDWEAARAEPRNSSAARWLTLLNELRAVLADELREDASTSPPVSAPVGDGRSPAPAAGDRPPIP